MEIKIKKLKGGAYIPKKSTVGAAALKWLKAKRGRTQNNNIRKYKI